MKPKQFLHLLRRKLAKIWLEINLQLMVVGVTGSYGKTSAVRAIAEVLSARYSINRTDLNLDTVYNLPITILKTKIWNEVLVLEYGIDKPGEMGEHLKLVTPKIAVFTGIAPVHTDPEHLGSLEELVAEKSKLIKAIPPDGLAVFNYDDEKVRKVSEQFSGRKIFYGTNSKADVWADKINVGFEGTTFRLHDGKQAAGIRTGLLGYPAVYSCLVAYAVGKELKVDKDRILPKLEKLQPLAGRFSLEKGPMETILVNDSRRANVVSSIVGLKSFAELPGRKIAVLGEMGEIGEQEEQMHRKTGKELAKLKIDFAVGVGPLTKFTIDEAEKKGMKKSQLFWAKDVIGAAEILRQLLIKGDLLYLKASLLRHLERTVLLLEGKKVSCNKTVCHHYSSCAACPHLLK